MYPLFEFLATGAKSGWCPYGPGTAGSLLGLAIWQFLKISDWPFEIQLSILTCSFLLGIFVSKKVALHWKEEDPKFIVIDEIVGMWIALSICDRLPLLNFVAFRILDIFKPPPIRQLDANVKGGLGIMIDDVAAGVFSGCITLFLSII